MAIFQIGPNRWTNRPPSRGNGARSDLPLPYVISDEMPPTEQVDGRFYTSKAKFRAVGRQLGLTEMGNDKRPPKKRIHSTRAERMASLHKAVAQYKAGRRVRV